MPLEPLKATWMVDALMVLIGLELGSALQLSTLKVMLKPPSDEPPNGSSGDDSPIDYSEIDIRLPMLVYVSREKRPGYDHNKKAGATNALVRASTILSNGPLMLNLDCDHYIYNSKAIREGMGFMMDQGGDRICYVQFPQRFEGIDPSDRYANHNTYARPRRAPRSLVCRNWMPLPSCRSLWFRSAPLEGAFGLVLLLAQAQEGVGCLHEIQQLTENRQFKAWLLDQFGVTGQAWLLDQFGVLQVQIFINLGSLSATENKEQVCDCQVLSSHELLPYSRWTLLGWRSF